MPLFVGRSRTACWSSLSRRCSWWGTYVAFNLPVDVLPDLNKPTVTILTEAGGPRPKKSKRLLFRLKL
jgi:Cu/Ag efflux pump CusA